MAGERETENSRMTIFLPFEIKDIGGTSTFARKFQEGMESAGHRVVFEYTPDYDVLFLIVQCPLKYLIDARRRRKKIVQRLDGTYYWTVSGWKFPLMNFKAAYIRHLFTDFTVYQSKYSQACAHRFLGTKVRDRYVVIYNGVDLARFTPKGRAKKLVNKNGNALFFTASAFRRKDQIEPILDALARYRERFGSSFHCIVAGTFRGEVANVPKEYEHLPYVSFIGKVTNDELPEYERAADVFLSTHLNPPCPNNIIEALACGLPICGVDDGAMPELVTRKSGRLISAGTSGFWRKRTLDLDRFAANIHAIVQDNQMMRGHARRSAERRFGLSSMIDGYVHVFESLIK
jgi:glycosyltransferase involved in cell wall biosynthesis